jgi:ATP-binding cassette subfamily B protein
MSAQNLLAKLTGVCMVVLSCFFYCQGSMDALTAVVMVISAFIVYASLETAGNYSALLRVVDVSVSRAQEILDTPQMDITGEMIRPENRNLAAEDVEFSYEKRKVIDGVTVEIPEKTTTAIVGPSGGGKTTLVNLLARFWDVDAGTVTLGGRNVKDYDMDSLMENFSFVFQNVYLFHDTIADNIRFGQPDAPMEKVIEAAKKACCHDFIEALPDGYETVIGEGGASLSGGEKQRISIARAMMKDAPVIFLDEATANVDPENENDLMRAIQALTEEKTVIMIAHRLKTVEHASQILVVDHGKIVQQGTHGKLMEEEGIYRDFISERREAASWKVKRQC